MLDHRICICRVGPRSTALAEGESSMARLQTHHTSVTACPPRARLDRFHFLEQRPQCIGGARGRRRDRLLDHGETVGQHPMAGMCLRPGRQRLTHTGRGIQALLIEQGDGRRRRLSSLDHRVAQFTAEKQVVGCTAAHRDAQPLAVEVGHLLCGTVLAHQIGAFDLHVRSTEGDAVGTRRIDGQEGQIPAVFGGRGNHRGCGVVAGEAGLHAHPLRQRGRQFQ